MQTKFYVIGYLGSQSFTQGPFDTDPDAQTWIDANAVMGYIYFIQEGQIKT